MAPSSFYPTTNSASLQPPIGTPVRGTALPVASPSHDAGLVSELWVRIKNVQQADRSKSELLDEMMYRYEFLSQQYQQLLNQRDPEIDLLRNWKQEKAAYESQARKVQAALARNPFVVLLIDGDGMIFQNDFIREGDAGGRRAAAQLHKAIESYVEHETQSIPIESRVICRIYANVKGLADVLVRTGAIAEAGLFEEFVRGFTRGKILFDFIDVGPGKDRADDKVIETLKLYANDFHCRQIFLGCSHDNGFARPLEEYMNDSAYVSKITLLEGVPFEKELLELPYQTKKFDGIFRESKINVQGAFYGMLSATNTPSPAPKTYSIVPGLPTHFPPANSYKSNTQGFVMGDSPLISHVKPDMQRTPSSSTLDSDGIFTTSKPVMNWAAKAAAPPPPVSPTPKHEPVKHHETISRNKHGQRVDPPTRDYNKSEVDRVKNIKLCNIHFLKQECGFGENCTHVHDYKPTLNELGTLRLVARMAPCQNGSACQDIKCIYGHRCPAPRSTKYNAAKGKTCIFGEACKFAPELHDIDCNVVKTIVVR